MKNVRKHRDIKVTATEKKKKPFNIKKKIISQNDSQKIYWQWK